MSKGATILLAVIWIGAIALGTRAIVEYSLMAGNPVIPTPRQSPDAAPDRGRLVLAIHPHCPCTRASISELARLVSRAGDSIEAHALVYRPEQMDDAWAHTGAWDELLRMPGVQVRVDPGGREAAALGITVSGGVVLFDGAGKPVFGGGITSSRGHEGPSVGQESILSWIRGRTVKHASAPVFGCSISSGRDAIPSVTGRAEQ